MNATSTLCRVVVLTTAAGALIIGSGTTASADDTVTTTTGQTLSIRACADSPAEEATSAAGVVKLSPGKASVKSVSVTLDGGKPEWVRLDASGHFRTETPWPSDWSRMIVRATVRATDGTTATSGCTLRRPGMVVEPSAPTPVLPNTGPPGREPSVRSA